MKKPTKAQLEKWESNKGFNQFDVVMVSPDGVHWSGAIYGRKEGTNHRISPLQTERRYARRLTRSEYKFFKERIRWEGESK